MHTFVHFFLYKYSPGGLKYFMDMVSKSIVTCFLYMGLNREVLCNEIIQILTSEYAGNIRDFKFSIATDMVSIK
jgi:hypothetical protein